MNIKIAWFVCFGALIVALPVRVYQMLFLVDDKTGFFTDHNVIAICLAIFMVVISAIIIFMCLYDKNAPKRFEPIRNIPAALTAAIGGASMIVHSVLALLMDNGGGNSVSIMESGQAYLNVIMAFIGVSSGIIILLSAFNFAVGKNIFRAIPVVGVIPPLWFCINLIILFTNYTNVTYVTENILDMFSIIFITFFLMAQGKMFAMVSPVKAGKRIYAFGLPGILYAFVSALPSFVLEALDMTNTSSLKMTLNITLFLLAIYALVFLLIYPKIPNYREEYVQEDKEIPEDEFIETEMTGQEPLPEEGVQHQEFSQASSEASPFILGEGEGTNGEAENQFLDPENDGRQIPYIINREPVFKLEKKEFKKEKKKKKRSVFYFIPVVKQYIDKKEAEEKRPAWTPVPRAENQPLKLENNWILDMYGYERRPKGSEVSKADEPYFPKVIDQRNIDKEQTGPVDKKENQERAQG